MKRDIYYEDYQMMSEALNKDAFLKRLGTSGMFTLNYRLMLDNRPQYVALYAVRPKDDVKHFIVSPCAGQDIRNYSWEIFDYSDN